MSLWHFCPQNLGFLHIPPQHSFISGFLGLSGGVSCALGLKTLWGTSPTPHLAASLLPPAVRLQSVTLPVNHHNGSCTTAPLKDKEAATVRQTEDLAHKEEEVGREEAKGRLRYR